MLAARTRYLVFFPSPPSVCLSICSKAVQSLLRGLCFGKRRYHVCSSTHTLLLSALKHCLLFESSVIFLKTRFPWGETPWISALVQHSCIFPFPECVSVCVCVSMWVYFSLLLSSIFPLFFLSLSLFFFFLNRRWHFHWPFGGSL